MMAFIRWLFVTLVIAAITHGALLYFGPSLIMTTAMGRMSAAAGGVNKMLAPPRPNAENNTVVRSSPDLLYNICVYDISEAPLRINANVPPGTYWSVSFYDMNTDNFRVINDGQASAGAVLLVLDRVGAVAPAGAELVTSPTDRGIILFRTLINDENRFSQIDAARRQADCVSARSRS